MEQSEKVGHWVFYPVILLAFLYPVNNSMLNLAIPLFFFRRGISTELIGLLSAGTTFAYTISPILLNKLSKKLPRKTSIIVALFGTLLAQVTFYFTLEPIPFLIARFSEGFIMGLYWTNLQSSISDNIYHDHKRMVARYNISWNVGVISGFWVGALLTFYYEDLTLIFLYAPLIIFISLIIAVFKFKEPNKILIVLSEEENASTMTLQKMKRPISYEKREQINLINFPKIFPVLLVIIFSLTRATINFVFPIRSDLLGFDTYTIYIALFFFALSQSICTYIASIFSTTHLKLLPQIMSVVLMILIPLLGITDEYYIFVIIFLVLGSCTGIIYGVSLRLILILNMKNQTSIYSGVLESFIGASFLIAPISSGFLANIDLNLPYYILSFLLLGINITLIGFINRKVNVD